MTRLGGPDNPKLNSIEINIFGLAPLIAGCPERLPEYMKAASRARSEIKRQSEHWDIRSADIRSRLYKLLFGQRMALEHVIVQIPATDLPNVQAGEDEPSRTPASEILGVKLHSGDILLSRGGAPTSALIARGNDFPGSFSHVALVCVDEKTGRASVIESHIERGVVVAPIDDYLREKKLRILVLRLRADLPAIAADPMLPHKAATAALAVSLRRHIPYDFEMNYRDHGAQFCSEVVTAAYEPFNVRLWTAPTLISAPQVVATLASFGVKNFETQEPAELEYDPQLRVVAEWRNQETLFKAQADDAVTDVMLERTPAGKPLPYRKPLLPLTRVAKAWSVILNRFGKVGPVPEGMSATTALRVKNYRNEHAVIAARLLQLSDEFKSRNGYLPPYWQLVTLARQARDQMRSQRLHD